MTIYLGLGSNQGDRRANLDQGLARLKQSGLIVSAVSPVVETPALLPDDAKSGWNRPFLNCAVAGKIDCDPHEALRRFKEIEKAADRVDAGRWAPRPLDIDILVWRDLQISEDALTIPHYGIADRPFVLTPLMHLQPDLEIPGKGRTVMEMCRAVHPVPLWMAILNITPDSFSDGSSWAQPEVLEGHINDLLDANIQIIDIGAESTRPNADTIDPDEEWRRLAPVFEVVNRCIAGREIRPMVSVDSRNADTIERALGEGADMVNDVSGLDDPRILQLVRESGCQAVAMHSVTIPVQPGAVLSEDESAVSQVELWLAHRLENWVDAGLDLNRIVIDPGIGFGKTPLQSIELLRNCAAFMASGLRLLVGHSRKSFMNGFTDQPFGERDLETLGISLALCHHGVDIIRVHDPLMHMRAYRAWAHVAG